MPPSWNSIGSFTKEANQMYNAVKVYTIVDDVLKALGHNFDKRQKMNDSEVITTVFMATMHFGGNIEKTCRMLKAFHLIPDMLSKSRFNRRMHALSDVIYSLFYVLADFIKNSNDSMEFIIDSFPVEVCQNIRISRCRIVTGEAYRGKIVSKRLYFYGVKVQVITTAEGIPVEIAFLPGEAHDSRAFDTLDFHLPEGSTLYGDSAYTDYDTEDNFKEQMSIDLMPQRKKRSQRGYEYPVKLLVDIMRKRIETVFSEINQLLPRKIHAVTFKGFLLKIFCFVAGYTIDKAFAN